MQSVPEPLNPTSTGDSEPGKFHSKQKERVTRSINRSRETSTSFVYPDLQDLEFGEIGSTNNTLPPPLRPSALDSRTEEVYDRGTLSDFSDYDSSGEELHEQSLSNLAVFHHTDNGDEDPFADPFAD